MTSETSTAAAAAEPRPYDVRNYRDDEPATPDELRWLDDAHIAPDDVDARVLRAYRAGYEDGYGDQTHSQGLTVTAVHAAVEPYRLALIALARRDLPAAAAQVRGDKASATAVRVIGQHLVTGGGR